MKRIFTILCAVLVSFGLSAQTDAGNHYLGGSMDISYSSESVNSIEVAGVSVDVDDDGSSTLGFSTNYGYFVMDNLMAHATFSMSNETEGDDTESENSFGIGARYYMNGMFGGVSYHMGSSKSEGKSTETVVDMDPTSPTFGQSFTTTTSYSEDGPSISTIQIEAGYAYMVSDNVAIEPRLYYNMVTATSDVANPVGTGDVERKIKGGQFGLAVGIGIYM